MKKQLFLSLLLPMFCFAGISEDLLQGPLAADDITDEWLIENAVPFHDTHPVLLFKKLFEMTKIKTFFEFGLGYPTKYLLEHSNKVISVDFITHGYGPETMKKFLNLYADYSNWIPIAFFSGYLGWDYNWAPYKHMGSDSVYRATSYQHANHKDYAKLDDFYLIELNAFITNLLKHNKADVAFIGHAIFLRGDIVRLLFDKVPIIIAHNTDKRNMGDMDDIYRLSQVVTPDNYEEIFFPLTGGTTAWIIKNDKYLTLIDALQKYSQN